MARTKNAPALAVGEEAPDFSLSSAQGGSLRLGMRTVRGPVVLAFFGGIWNEKDVAFFKSLAKKEDEINAALGSVVGVCASEPEAAREFQKKVGLKSYILYDHTTTVTAAWGVLESDPEHGPHARSATFIVDKENRISAVWTGARPDPEELLAAVSAITGLPKPDEPEETTDGEEDGNADGGATATQKPARPRRTARKSGDAAASEDKDDKAASEERPANGVEGSGE